MAAQSQFKKAWLSEAMETLSHYNTRPFTTDFMKRYKIPIKKGMTRIEMHKKIKQRINSTKPPFFRDLVNYLDELKMYGKQHVFLYTLKPAQSDYLKKLRDAAYIKNQLKKYRLRYLFNNKKMVWNSQKPKLSEVQYSYNSGKSTLVFKWIETRRFFKNIAKTDPPVFKVKTERSVAFFIVNLENGNAEIRIQCLQSHASRNLRQELETYKNEISKYIDLHLFTPVTLEPIVRTLFGKSTFPIHGWKIVYPEGRVLIGAKDPSFFFKLGLPFRNFFSSQITLCWEVKQKSRGDNELFFTINGEDDEVLFNAITDKEKVNFILNYLRKIHTEGISMPELKQIAVQYPEYSRVLSGMDYHFSQLKKTQVDRKTLISELWYPEQTIQNVFKETSKQFPKKFVLKGKTNSLLSIVNRFNFREGLRIYFERKMGQSGKKHLATPIAVTTFLTTSFLSYCLSDLIKSYLMEHLFERIFPGFPFIVFQIIVLLFIAIVHFGSNSFGFLKKIPKAWISTVLGFFFGKKNLK